MVAYQKFRHVSSRKTNQHYDPNALAEQQFSLVLYDTADAYYSWLIDQVEPRSHIPIGLELRQTSYAWSSGFSKRFIIVDYWFRNISDRYISDAYIGFNFSGETMYAPHWPIWGGDWVGDFSDQVTGFLSVVPGIYPGTLDTVNIAWSANNDGDPVLNGVFANTSKPGVLGIRILRAPVISSLAYNWWVWAPSDWNMRVFDWGPRLRENRLGFFGNLGTPLGDRGVYRMMMNAEIDYDQAYAAIDFSHKGWAPPPTKDIWRYDIPDGMNPECLLSVGPIESIAPGDSIPLTVAIVMGADFHTNPRNFANNFHPENPKPYLDNLNFQDLIKNARWADWVFDTPGVDTDGDGDRGRVYLVNCDGVHCDSVFYKGDGVPDYRGPHAPPPPGEFELVTKPRQAILRWSGAFSELERDYLSLKRDFEGYRVYVGKFDRDDQFSLLASWDREDYKRFAYVSEGQSWHQISDPLTVDQWQSRLEDPTFHPDDYALPSLEYAYRDTVVDTLRNHLGDIIRITERERSSYWVPQEANRENRYWETDRWEDNPIQRVDVRDTTILDKKLTYGIYEVIIDNLNPSVPLYFAVTTFDFGNYEFDLPPLESSPSNNSKYGEPIYSSDVVVDSGLRVSVFPNPYKTRYLDAKGKPTTYYLEGYEGRGVADFAEQDRRIHFINLPDTATISIYSLDGDLIRTIHHPDPFLTTYSSSVGWDLVSRNAQAVTSGIYIWKVDSKLGSQTGKLVIIK